MAKRNMSNEEVAVRQGDRRILGAAAVKGLAAFVVASAAMFAQQKLETLSPAEVAAKTTHTASTPERCTTKRNPRTALTCER